MTRQPSNAEQSRSVAALHGHALGTLQYIRRSIETAGSFDVPGLAGIAMGSIGLLAALLASLESLRELWLHIWLAAAPVASVAGVALMTRQAARNGVLLYRGPARKFFLCLSPSLAVGALLSAILWRRGLADLLPGVWLCLYGCAILSASAMATRLMEYLGAAFLALGVAAFGLDAAWFNVLLGAGFGGLHVVFGLILGRRSDER